jgi:hypothetical protein
MTLEQFRNKPAWEVYEAALLDRGFAPRWDPDAESNIVGITCRRCRGVPSYVGMTDGTTSLGFLACRPECGEWIGFRAPAPSSLS